MANMLATVLWFMRKPLEYIGLLDEHETKLTEYEAELVKKYHDFFKEETPVYKELQGHVTQLSNNAIELNHKWIYELVLDGDNFTVGDHVSWKLYDTKTGPVVKDVVRVSDKNKFEVKTISCAQIARVDGTKYQTTGGIIFYLDKVQCHPGYRPMCLDFVNLECLYLKEDPDSEEFDPDPSLLLVKRVSPSGDRLVPGKITLWDPSTFSGVVNDTIVFHQDVCIQVTPTEGATVACDCVQGDYKEGYTMRAYKITKNNPSNKKHFFVVEYIPPFEVVLGETKTVELCVTNQSTNRPCRVTSVEFFVRNQKTEINHGLKFPYTVMPGTRASWPVDVVGNSLGRQELKMQWKINENKFPIYSTIVYRTVQQNLGQPEANPGPRKRAALVIPGQRRIRNPVYRRVPMREYPVNERLREICSESSGLDLIEIQLTLNNERPFLAEYLSPQNYGDFMHTLLFLEEIAQEKFYNRLATRGALFRTRDCVTFNFPADSDYTKVVCGDRVRASKPWEEVKYDAIVWAISSTQLSLKFGEVFENMMPSAAQFDLEFLMNRRPNQRLHQAVDLVLQNLGADWLFPSELYSDNTGPATESKIENIAWYNTFLNFEQKTAVKNILAKKNLPYPYIIYGPPGTGKTVTIVEAILQMVSRQSDYRILVTAPTNSAVDTLGLRLLEFGVFDKTEMIRMSSYNAYSSGQIAAQLMDIAMVPSLGDPSHDTPISRDNESTPTLYLDELSKFKIIIGTLASISYLNCSGIPKGYFTHIIIDEAGQCHEPETLLPIALVQPNRTQLVLAGDPQQLGPNVASLIARQYSFDISFLDRMTKAYLYRKKADDFKDTHGYNPGLITKLVLNYRSLPKIVRVVGSVFYGGDLRPTISDEHSREAKVLMRLTIHGVDLKDNMDSMIFINVNTPEEQVEGNMSWMNHGEVAQVFFVLNLLYCANVSPDDIGIITPYALQKKKIYEYLDNVGAHSPKVASVEEFQGQERDVIILSLVRNNLGISKRLSDFVTDPHRVNVAMSRARVLNVIIGNRNTLLASPLWAQIISKCRLINVASYPDPD